MAEPGPAVTVPGRLDAPFLAAASIALDLISRPEVSQRWDRPSALPKMSVGALACHLGRQTSRVAELLPRSGDLPLLDSADEHYARAAWVRSASPDDPVNDRSQDDAEAGQGPSSLVDRATAALALVRELLDAGSASDVVPIPWRGWSLRRDDFLLTRLLEIVVHSDDLATSVEIATPEFPEPVFGPVCDLLVRLAVRRRGQPPLIGTLARSERTQVISAF